MKIFANKLAKKSNRSRRLNICKQGDEQKNKIEKQKRYESGNNTQIDIGQINLIDGFGYTEYASLQIRPLISLGQQNKATYTTYMCGDHNVQKCPETKKELKVAK